MFSHPCREMADSPMKAVGAVVRCSVYSEDKKIPDSFRFVSADIYKAVNRIGKALLVFEAGDMSGVDVPESNDETFAPGKKIRIEAGYDEDENPIFEGIVISHGVQILSGNRGTLRIECRDYAFPATLARNSKVFSKAKDSDAICAILKAYTPLAPSVDATAVTYPELVQYYCTDWDFILSRAEANGLVVLTDGKGISVKKPKTDGAPLLSVRYGTDVIEFTGELSASEQFADATATAWDPSAQKTISAQGAAPALNSQGSESPQKLAKATGNPKCNLQTVSDAGTDALKRWADSMLILSGLGRIRGEVRFYGNPKALPGTLMALDGFGKRFNGNAYVGSVEHRIEKGDWTTTVGMGLPEESVIDKNDMAAPPAAGLLSGIEGLHVGKVTKPDGDPAGESRIQIALPLLGLNDNLIWARLGNLWSSGGYGAFFIPDVGDEVVVGFFNNDPRYPVILGSMYSSKQKPPYELTRENYTRAFTTKSKMKIAFDEEKKVITMLTPGKNTIEISDEGKGIKISDQNNNLIEMNNNGIVLKSPKDITIKSDMNIRIEAGTAIDMKAKTDLKVKGLNVEAKADMSVKIQGSAQAELSASGQTVIKGAMVMIN